MFSPEKKLGSETREKIPEIEILRGVENAEKAKGLVVVIDVFRAFSAACYMMDKGVERIISVDDIDAAYGLKENNPRYLLVGERHGRMQPGFDFNNSPKDLLAADLRGRTVVYSTSSGTRGLEAVKNAEQVITGSFVNAGAVRRYAAAQKPEAMSLLTTTLSSRPEAEDEDFLMAEYLRDAMKSGKTDFKAVVSSLRRSKAAVRSFFDPDTAWAPKEDFDLCLDLDRFNFVLKTERGEDGLLDLVRIDVP